VPNSAKFIYLRFPYAESKLPSYHVVKVCKAAELPGYRVVETPSWYYCSSRNKMTAREGLKLPSCQAAALPSCRANVKRHWSKWARYQQDYCRRFNLDNWSAPSLLLPLPMAFVTPVASSKKKKVFDSIRKHLIVHRRRKVKQCQRNFANTI